MKTSELTGAALDWAVAQIEKPRLSQSFARKNVVVLAHGGLYAPTIDWAQGGPIIEREKIDVIADPNGKDVWMGRLYLNWVKYEAFATTPLIAAMRCYVASKLGDDVDVPKELL
jgi:hypothetical protein